MMALLLPLISLSAEAATAYRNSVASVNQEDNGTTVGYDASTGMSTLYEDNIDADREHSVDVSVSQASSFSLKIPKKIILNGKYGEENSGDYEVEVEGNLAADEIVSVTPVQTAFNLSSPGKANIEATVVQNKTGFTYSDGVRIGGPIASAGTVKAEGMTAGEWHGGYQFNVNLTSFSNPQLIEYFTWGPDSSVTASYSAGTLSTDYPYLVEAEENENSTYSYPDKTQITGLTADGVSWLRSNGGILTIPNSASSIADGTGTLNFAGVFSVANSSYCSQINNRITEVYIADSVKEIGDGAFSGQQNLTSVYLGKTENIGDCSFMSTGITALDLNDTVTTIGNSTFRACRNLKNVAGLSNVSTITSYAFCDDIHLAKVSDMDNITTINNGAFSYCYELESVDLEPSTLQSVNGTDTFLHNKIPMSYWKNFSGTTFASQAVYPNNISINYTYAANKANKAIEFTGFSQRDSRWTNTSISSLLPSNYTFGPRGCSWMCLTAINNYLNKENLTPVQFAKYFEDNYSGEFDNSDGSFKFNTDGIAGLNARNMSFNSYYLSNNQHSKIQSVVNALSEGKLVTLNYKQSNNSGHMVVLYGIEEDGCVDVANSSHPYYAVTSSGIELLQESECLYYSIPIENMIVANSSYAQIFG